MQADSHETAGKRFNFKLWERGLFASRRATCRRAQMSAKQKRGYGKRFVCRMPRLLARPHVAQPGSPAVRPPMLRVLHSGRSCRVPHPCPTRLPRSVSRRLRSAFACNVNAAADTARVDTRSATKSGLAAHVRSSVQRGWQTNGKRKRKPARNGSPAHA